MIVRCLSRKNQIEIKNNYAYLEKYLFYQKQRRVIRDEMAAIIAVVVVVVKISFYQQNVL